MRAAAVSSIRLSPSRSTSDRASARTGHPPDDGVDTRHILAGPVIEGSVASIGSVVIGVPIGIGLAVVAIRVLDLLFALPPPLVVVPWIDLVALAALVIAASALALGIALLAFKRRELASVLREP
jgi:putative ABC transport system permease protein